MHTKGHIRDYFEVLVDERFFGSEELDLEDVAGVSDDEEREVLTVQRLLGLLCHSTAVMPSLMRTQLQGQRGWGEEAFTYGQAAQRIHAELKAT